MARREPYPGREEKMWYRCLKHGRYNVQESIMHQVQCPGCIAENEQAKLLAVSTEEIEFTSDEKKVLEEIATRQRGMIWRI